MGFFEKFIREFWIILDSFRKSTRQFERIIDELPQPFLILGPNTEILLQNSAASSYLTRILFQSKDMPLFN